MKEITFTASRPFVEWLHARGRAVAFTSCDAECLIIVTAPQPGQIASAFYPAPVAMGLAYRAGNLYLTDRFGIHRLAIEPATPQRPVHVIRPSARYLVGGLDLHEVSIGRGGTMWSTATVGNSVGVVNQDGFYEPRYRPPFISSEVLEDRCHMNGLALVDGEPGYVTCVSKSDVIDAWRDRRRDGGIVLDCRTGEVVASGLSMPHCPRLLDGRLWVMNSGAGEVGWVDLEQRKFVPLAFYPGFARGFAIEGDHYLIGLSKPRAATTFGGVPLEERLASAGADARCAIHLCEKATGRTVGWLRMDGTVREIFDLTLLQLRGRVAVDMASVAQRVEGGAQA